MIPIRTASYFFLVLILGVGASSCENSSNNGKGYLLPNLPKAARKAYKSDRPVVLFSYRESITRSEAFGDWKAYLDAFKEDAGSTFLYLKVENKEVPDLSPETEEFTLFIKRGYPTYVYEGLIVEPQVYTAVYKSYSDMELEDVDLAFMPKTLNPPPAKQ